MSELSYLPSETGLTRDDLIIPRWKVDKNTGEFVNTMTGEVKQALSVVILKIDTSRFLWQEPYGVSKVPSCFSPDGVRPQCEHPVSDNCFECPMADWTGTPENKVKPRCTLSYNYLLYDTETEIVSVLNLTRSRTMTAKSLNSFWRLNGVKFPVQLYTEKVRDGMKEYFSVKFIIQTKLPDWTPFAVLMLENKKLQLTSGTIEDDEEINDNAPNGAIEF